MKPAMLLLSLKVNWLIKFILYRSKKFLYIKIPCIPMTTVEDLTNFRRVSICLSFYFNPFALRKAKIVYNFGLSECNRVNEDCTCFKDCLNMHGVIYHFHRVKFSQSKQNYSNSKVFGILLQCCLYPQHTVRGYMYIVFVTLSIRLFLCSFICISHGQLLC